MNFSSNADKKSVVKTRSFNDQKTSNPKILWSKLLINVDRLFEDMALHEYEIRHIRLYLKTKEKEHYAISHYFEDYTCDRKEIYSALQKLFKEIYKP
jgi:ethanolamine utilization cobalamin adenosyltransferase